MNIETLKKAVDEVNHRITAVYKDYFYLWRDYMFLSWRWFLALALTIIPWVVWIIVRKKDSTCRLLFAGFFVLIISSFLDMVGIVLNLWDYPTALLPLMPDYIFFDFSVIPVVTMLFIQFFPEIKPYWKAAVYAVSGALVFQPLMEWAGLYCHEKWADWYSIPILFGIYMFADFLATRKNYQVVR